jgi:hypothetical protein
MSGAFEKKEHVVPAASARVVLRRLHHHLRCLPARLGRRRRDR